MALIEVRWNPDRRELKQFALICVAFFGLFAAYYQWFKSSPTAATVFWIITAVGIVGYFFPSVLRPAWILWMALAMPIGWVVSHLLLLAVFYLVVTPVGLAMRLVGYDPLNRMLDRSATTYWFKHNPSADLTSYFKQY